MAYVRAQTHASEILQVDDADRSPLPAQTPNLWIGRQSMTHRSTDRSCQFAPSEFYEFCIMLLKMLGSMILHMYIYIYTYVYIYILYIDIYVYILYMKPIISVIPAGVLYLWPSHEHSSATALWPGSHKPEIYERVIASNTNGQSPGSLYPYYQIITN